MFDKTAKITVTDQLTTVGDEKYVLAQISSEGRPLLAVRHHLSNDSIAAYIAGARQARQELANLLTQMAAEVEATTESSTTWYIPAAEEPLPSAQLLASSVAVSVRGKHEHVRVWNRGGCAGMLIVGSGDGEKIALALGLHLEVTDQNKPVAPVDPSR